MSDRLLWGVLFALGVVAWFLVRIAEDVREIREILSERYRPVLPPDFPRV